MDNKILVTGGDGRFAKILKDKNKKLNLIFCSKKQLDILNLKSIKKNFKKHKPKIILHCTRHVPRVINHDPGVFTSRYYVYSQLWTHLFTLRVIFNDLALLRAESRGDRQQTLQ